MSDKPIMTLIERLHQAALDIFARKVRVSRVTVTNMTAEQQKAFDAAFAQMDIAFVEMDKAFAALKEQDPTP